MDDAGARKRKKKSKKHRKKESRHANDEDAWIEELGTEFTADQSRALLSGLSSQQADDPAYASAWDAVVQPGLLDLCDTLGCEVLQRVSSELLVPKNLSTSK